MKSPILALCLLFMMSRCAGIGLIHSDNPDIKLAQAYRMMDESRLLMAEDLLKKAMARFALDGNKSGMADTYHAFGNLYKNDLYHGKFAAAFKAAGTYDPSYTKSIENFSSGFELFQQLSDESGAIKCIVGMASAYGQKGDQPESCKLYHQAKQRYDAAVSAGRMNEPIMLNPNYKNMGELINAFIKGYCE